MRTFHRWFYRIFVPLLVVAAVAVVLRWIMISEFHERNVASASGASLHNQTDRADGESMPYSAENKEHVVAALKLSKSQLDESLKRSPERAADEEIASQEKRLEKCIEELKTAEESNWENRRDAAYHRLNEYARSVGRITENAES